MQPVHLMTDEAQSPVTTRTKMVEVRHKGVLIPMLAIRCLRSSDNDDAESWLLKRGGFEADNSYVLLCPS